MSKIRKYSQVAVGPCRYRFSLQWVVFCWCTQKGRQIPPSWAQKQGTPEGEWTHSAEVESSLHLRYDCSWNILQGFLTPNMLAMNFCPSVHVHSPLIELKDELSSWGREGDSQWLSSSASKSRHLLCRLQPFFFYTTFVTITLIHDSGIISHNANNDCFLRRRHSSHGSCSYLFSWVKCL